MTATEVQYSFDDELGLHDPELYDFAAVAEGVNGFAALDDTQVARYHEQGFLAVHNAFTREEVSAVLDGLTDLIAGRVPEFTNIQFRGEVRDRLAALSVEERIDSVRRLLYFTEHEPRARAMALHLQLLGAVEKLLGAPPQLFQSMALIKPPRGREKPWHQDHAYFELPLATRVVGVWIALDPAGVDNGCMRFLPGWQRKGVFTHFQRRDWQICDSEMTGLREQRVAVPLAPGGCVLFDSYIPHGTPSNFTSARRRAVQFHYLAAGISKITPEQRVEIWGGKAREVVC
jgi:phytanoyl-CoA hydroxylase